MLIFNKFKVYISSYLQCKSMKIKKKLLKTGGSKRDISKYSATNIKYSNMNT